MLEVAVVCGCVHWTRNTGGKQRKGRRAAQEKEGGGASLDGPAFFFPFLDVPALLILFLGFFLCILFAIFSPTSFWCVFSSSLSQYMLRSRKLAASIAQISSGVHRTSSLERPQGGVLRPQKSS
jgi:hypothetical protein